MDEQSREDARYFKKKKLSEFYSLDPEDFRSKSVEELLETGEKPARKLNRQNFARELSKGFLNDETEAGAIRMARLVDEAIDDAISYSTRPGAIDKILEKYFEEPISTFERDYPGLLEEKRRALASDIRTTIDKLIEQLDYQVIDRKQASGMAGSVAIMEDGSAIMTIATPKRGDQAVLMQGRDPRGVMDNLSDTLRHEFLHVTQDLYDPKILNLFKQDHLEWQKKFNKVTRRSTRRWLRDLNDTEGKKVKADMLKTLILSERSAERAELIKDLEQLLEAGDIKRIHARWILNNETLGRATYQASLLPELVERVKGLRYEMVRAGIIEHLDEPITKAHADQLLDHWWEKSIHGIGVKPGQDMPNPDEKGMLGSLLLIKLSPEITLKHMNKLPVWILAGSAGMGAGVSASKQSRD